MEVEKLISINWILPRNMISSMSAPCSNVSLFPANMSRKGLHLCVLILFLTSFGFTTAAESAGACSSSCGTIANIRNPFRLHSDPSSCGSPKNQLYCRNNQTLLNLGSRVYVVDSISYGNQTIRLLDPGLNSTNCSSLPKYSLKREDLRNESLYTFVPDPYDLNSSGVTYVSCPDSVDDTAYIETVPCLNHSSGIYYYALVGDKTVSDLKKSCTSFLTVPMDYSSWTNPGLIGNGDLNYLDVWRILLLGLQLSWRPSLCAECDAGAGGVCLYPEECEPYAYRADDVCPRGAFQSVHCFFHNFWEFIKGYGVEILTIAGYILAGRAALGMFCSFTFLIYKLHREYISKKNNIERFLETFQDLIPTRYSYSEIKKITSRFKDKLGQGGFGSVFKGTLASGRPVAVKILGKSRANGEDFISEVSTIGRIHHVNVVQLIGFCSEGSKRALIYEYMPNGSLDKYIYPKEGQASPLSIAKMYDIAVGAARGIEYLHRGCDMQILHFDIKPHNVLLDANFTPKVSDFGLAKLYPTDNSIVPVSACRGTIGYSAPELIYRKFGRISYKSDVYSFGRLLLEMIGRRRDVDACWEMPSDEDFPSWIHDQLIRGGEVAMDHGTESGSKIARMLLMVGLWCIQMRPEDRPTMHEVVEMLEGSVEDLPMPPRPYLSFPSEGNIEISQLTEEDDTEISPSKESFETQQLLISVTSSP